MVVVLSSAERGTRSGSVWVDGLLSMLYACYLLASEEQMQALDSGALDTYGRVRRTT